MSVNVILSTGQGHGQVTKGRYIQKSHCGHVIHVLWPIVAIEFDGYVSLVVSVAEWSKALESDANAGGESPVRAPVRAATLCPYA